MSIRLISLLFVSIIGFSSCEDSKTTEQPFNHPDNRIGDTLIQANKFLLERDKEQIQSYINRRSWELNITESGLWYEIYEKSKGQEVKSGNIVKYNYKIELLDGTICYSSDSLGSAQIKIGQSGKESGLEEGLKMMKIGEKGRFILPPHLAHGLIGDMERIPHRSVIVYDVNILDIIEF